VSAQALGRSSPPVPASATAAAASGRRELWEWLGLAAIVLLAPAAVVYLSFNAGGYFPNTPALVAIGLALALVLRTTLAERPFEGFSRTLALPLSALALYAAWELASGLWAHATARTLDAYDRTLLYVLAFALFGALRYTRARASWLVRALMLGLVAVCLAGLISRTLPHLWPTTAGFFANRLNYPLTYWNAEGMIAAMALILGFHLSADPREHPAIRVLAAGALPALGATLLLTFSRGSLGVAAIGLVAYCLLARLSTLPATLLAAVPTTAIAMRSAWDATALAGNDPTSRQAVSQGHHVAVVVGVCVLVALLARAALLLLDRRIAATRLVQSPPSLRVRAGIAVGAAFAAVVLALALGAGGYVQREYDKFINGTKEPKVAQTRERLTDPANDGRLPLWRAALDIYRTEPLRGTGAGTYQQLYTRYRSEAAYVTDAHSLYLQSLAELGIVGLALIVLVVGGMLLGLALRIRGPDRGLYAALFAVVLAWAVHQAVDWDWQMPAVTVSVFMLCGLALARGRDGGVGLRGLPAGRPIVALGWLVLAVAPFLVGTSYARLQEAGSAFVHGNCQTAKHDALSSLSLAAKRPQAYALIGVCDLQQGFAPAAVSAMTKATEYEPQSWEDWYWLAVARAAAGEDPRPAARRALALNPRELLLKNAVRHLDHGGPRQWEALAPRLGHEALISGKFAITSL
jgi:hypothetical protein